MPLPVLSAAAQRLYDNVKHLEVDRPEEGYFVEAEGWPWATLCQALAAPVDPLYDLVAVPQHPWQPMYDVDAAPDWTLPFLAMHEGVKLPPGLTPAQIRARIKDGGGRRRGRLVAITTAARETLTGNRYVFYKEREGGDPDALVLVTRTSETTDPAFTLKHAAEQVAAGMKFSHLVTEARTWLEIQEAGGGTWAGVAATYGTWEVARGF